MGYLNGWRALWRYTRESCAAYAFLFKHILLKVCPKSNKRLIDRAHFKISLNPKNKKYN